MELGLLHQILDKLESMESEIKDVKSEIKDVKSEIKDVKSEIKDVRSDIKDIRQGQAETNTKLDNLTDFVHGIHIHQEMDYKLLKAVDEKIVNLVNVSETYEQIGGYHAKNS